MAQASLILGAKFRILPHCSSKEDVLSDDQTLTLLDICSVLKLQDILSDEQLLLRPRQHDRLSQHQSVLFCSYKFKCGKFPNGHRGGLNVDSRTVCL